jgi:hypothetical protein
VGAATLAEEKREDLRLHLEAMERATRSANLADRGRHILEKRP